MSHAEDAGANPAGSIEARGGLERFQHGLIRRRRGFDSLPRDDKGTRPPGSTAERQADILETVVRLDRRASWLP